MTIVVGKHTINSGSGGVEEAPIDGSTYGRKDAAWALIPDAAETMLWGGSWTEANTPYSPNTLAKDGAFSAVAIVETSDRLAPQPEGQPTYNLPEDGLGFTTKGNLSVVYSGHLYEFIDGGWLKRIRVWVPQLTEDTNYRVIVIDETDPANPKVSLVTSPILSESGWAVVGVDNIVIKAGAKIRVLLDSLNSGSDTIVSGGWNYNGSDNVAIPAAQGWNRNNQNSIVRIDKTDLDSVDRTTELNGVTLNSTLQFVQTNDTSKSVSYTVIGIPVDQGTYVEYPVIITDTNNGGVDVAAASTVTITIPVPQNTQYSEIEDYWVTNSPSYATITGVLEYDGVSVAGVEDNAYGIDLEFQKANVSLEWDYLPTGGASSGSSYSDLEKFIYTVDEGDDKGVVITEQLSVGTPSAPRESVFGMGDSTTIGMKAYHTDDEVTYTDITEIFSSDDGSTTGLFGGTGAGNTVYVGSDFIYSGVKVKINTDGVIEPENVIAEFWTGSSWTPTAFMATSSDEPLTSFGWQLAQNSAGSEQWYFNFDPNELNPTWIKSEVEGVSKYWARLRVVTPITTDPVIEQVKLHTSRYEINAYGQTQYFGSARYKKTLLSGISNLINNAAQSPANEAVAYAPGVVAGYQDNQFNNNAIDSRLFVLNVDEGLDTSIPIEVKLSWYVDGLNTGDVEFKISKIPVGDGFVYDGSGVLESEQSETTSVQISSNLVRMTTTLNIPINDGGPETPAYMMVVQRDATGGNPSDTLDANIILTHITVNGWFWKP